MDGEYLIRFVQAHETFRRPELEALARYENVDLELKDYRETSPFVLVRLKSPVPNGSSETLNSLARSFISRSILSKGIFELWGSGVDYDSLHADVKSRSQHLWGTYRTCSFKFSLDAFYGKRSLAEQRDIFDSFKYLAFQGKTRMKDPDVEFLVMEEWEESSGPAPLQHYEQAVDQDTKIRAPKRIFLGRLVGTSRRNLIDKHDLKKRPYISTTSMDAELALVTASLALAAPGKLFLDPFVGTGGFMVAASELGALSLGSDIDGRSFRGKRPGRNQGVHLNFSKYGLEALFGDCVTSDITNTPFRTGRSIHLNGSQVRWLDGIISDPPYGIREGLKVLGMRSRTLPGTKADQQSTNTRTTSEEDMFTGPNPHQDDQIQPAQPYLINGIPAYTLPGYIAPKKPYSFDAMLDDILDFAAQTLVDGGRLAFWMPSANEDVTETEANGNAVQSDTVMRIPLHPRLRLVHVCTQSFNKWSRRLLVYERLVDGVEGHEGQNGDGGDGHPAGRRRTQGPDHGDGASADALNPFRKMYFRGFQN